MKKTLLALALAVGCSFSSFAQVLPSWMVLRVSGGGNLSKHKYSEGFYSPFDYSRKAYYGFQGGIGVGVKVGEKFVLMLEPTFVQQGNKFELSNPDDITNYAIYKQTIASLHIPLIGRFQMGTNWGFTAGFGLSPNISFSGKQNIQGYTLGEPDEPDNNTINFGTSRDDFYDSFDLSLIIEPSLFFNLNDEGTKRLTVGARWDLGLREMKTDLQKQYWRLTGIEKQRSFMINVGLEIRPEW